MARGARTYLDFMCIPSFVRGIDRGVMGGKDDSKGADLTVTQFDFYDHNLQILGPSHFNRTLSCVNPEATNFTGFHTMSLTDIDSVVKQVQ